MTSPQNVSLSESSDDWRVKDTESGSENETFSFGSLDVSRGDTDADDDESTDEAKTPRQSAASTKFLQYAARYKGFSPETHRELVKERYVSFSQNRETKKVKQNAYAKLRNLTPRELNLLKEAHKVKVREANNELRKKTKAEISKKKRHSVSGSISSERLKRAKSEQTLKLKELSRKTISTPKPDNELGSLTPRERSTKELQEQSEALSKKEKKEQEKRERKEKKEQEKKAKEEKEKEDKERKEKEKKDKKDKKRGKDSKENKGKDEDEKGKDEKNKKGKDEGKDEKAGKKGKNDKQTNGKDEEEKQGKDKNGKEDKDGDDKDKRNKGKGEKDNKKGKDEKENKDDEVETDSSSKTKKGSNSDDESTRKGYQSSDETKRKGTRKVKVEELKSDGPPSAPKFNAEEILESLYSLCSSFEKDVTYEMRLQFFDEVLREFEEEKLALKAKNRSGSKGRGAALWEESSMIFHKPLASLSCHQDFARLARNWQIARKIGVKRTVLCGPFKATTAKTECSATLLITLANTLGEEETAKQIDKNFGKYITCDEDLLDPTGLKSMFSDLIGETNIVVSVLKATTQGIVAPAITKFKEALEPLTFNSARGGWGISITVAEEDITVLHKKREKASPEAEERYGAFTFEWAIEYIFDINMLELKYVRPFLLSVKGGTKMKKVLTKSFKAFADAK